MEVKIVDHPVLQHKLSFLRSSETDSKEFRLLIEEISQLLAYEVTKDLKTTSKDISTPMGEAKGMVIDEDLTLISIMRAGNSMLEGMMSLLSFAKVGHIGIYRDKFVKNTVEYFFRVPEDIKGKRVILLDPLLATGQTAVAAISRLKQYDVGTIRFVTLVAATEGIERLKEYHPDIELYTLSIEPELDKEGYIIPGIGDASSRLYGTV